MEIGAARETGFESFVDTTNNSSTIMLLKQKQVSTLGTFKLNIKGCQLQNVDDDSDIDGEQNSLDQKDTTNSQLVTNALTLSKQQ